MNGTFQNRMHAGQMLAPWLRAYAGRLDVILLGLPRGGVPVAAEVARELSLPLDVLCVRKVGVPGREELAMGAVAPGGVVVRNEAILASFGIADESFALVARREQGELERRERLYRQARPPLDLHGQVAVLVDDGVATGATIKAAIRAARALGARSVLVATPVIARDALDELQRDADEVFTVLAPETFFAIGEFYEDFGQTGDAEVRRLLATSARETVHPSTGGPS